MPPGEGGRLWKEALRFGQPGSGGTALEVYVGWTRWRVGNSVPTGGDFDPQGTCDSVWGWIGSPQPRDGADWGVQWVETRVVPRSAGSLQGKEPSGPNVHSTASEKARWALP